MPIQKKRISPRQKMINLMYLVLLAMLALNVSSDVLNGFSLVSDGLNKSTQNANKVNQGIYADFDKQMKSNPAKVKTWYDKAQYVKSISDSLYNLADELKIAIVKESDGKDGNVEDIKNREDLEASTQVMLSPTKGRGKELYTRINSYREQIVGMLTDPEKQEVISSNLNTEVPLKGQLLGKNWQEYMFENMPTAAAVTLLTKLQNDVRHAESEVLHTLINNVDVKDVRVNLLEAYVIPNSQTVVQGGRFSAQIFMAAVDTTQRPTIYVGGKQIQSEKGIYETVCNSTGDFTLNGYIEMLDGSGETVRRDFSQKYTVVAPSATVSADIMNVLYAGYDNPMSVSVPGVPRNQISCTMTGGSLTPKGDGHFIARPSNPGDNAVITVHAQHDGRSQEMGKFTFRVRKLPDPKPFIAYTDANGAEEHFDGGGLSKQVLVNTDGIGAAIDDGLLNIAFQVLGFETVFYDAMGNAVPYKSNGAHFSDQQKGQIRGLARNKRFYITNVQAKGPDGIERTLSGAMEVIIK
ncbi:MAG: gliding motility protein GldM [Bacteroidaceae bacterium]|nr:gliding motility protein GldM [Bacteroidaceae bacterium]